MSESPVRGTAVLGQSARFQCTAIGDIEPSFTWSRNGVKVDGGKLSMFNVIDFDFWFQRSDLTKTQHLNLSILLAMIRFVEL